MSDHSTIQQIEARMRSCTKRLQDMVPQVGAARQIKEFSSDRRKMALSMAMMPFLKDGDSATAAEANARASAPYGIAMDAMEEQYRTAETTLAQWTAEQASFEAARSLLSMQKQVMNELKG